MNILCMTSFGQGSIDFNINAANAEEMVEFGLDSDGVAILYLAQPARCFRFQVLKR